MTKALAYVLVADTDSQRIEICLDAVKTFGVGGLVARKGEEAIRVLKDFGAPLLLIVDLLLPQQSGVSLIETVRRLDLEGPRILAWASTRDLREFAACRLASTNARILAGSVAPSVIRSTIAHLLSGTALARAEGLSSQSAAAEALHETMTELAAKARAICGTAGVAVYLRGGPDQPFRSSATWSSDEPIPKSLDYLPTALKRIIATREPLVALDLASDGSIGALRHAVEGLRGLVAVPILESDRDEVVGMICVFDVKAIALSSAELDALKALGRRRRMARPSTAAIAIRPVPDARERLKPGTAHPSGFRPLPIEGPATLLERQVGALALTREMARARRKENTLSVVVFSVDSATAADTEGPELMPNPVESVGYTLTRVIRGYDLAIRWGRQEWLVVLSGVREAEAGRVAERVRDAVTAGMGAHVDLAGGVAELEQDNTFESIVVRANENLRARRHSANLQS